MLMASSRKRCIGSQPQKPVNTSTPVRPINFGSKLPSSANSSEAGNDNGRESAAIGDGDEIEQADGSDIVAVAAGGGQQEGEEDERPPERMEAVTQR